ncbi:MAG: DUF3520 domain-containing protein [bacterium]|nr:DUF3520 domain-containing protein [bacterium]
MMKNRIFQDLQVKTQSPYSLWKFFLFSTIIHGLMLFSMISMDFTPTPPGETTTVHVPRKYSGSPITPDSPDPSSNQGHRDPTGFYDDPSPAVTKIYTHQVQRSGLDIDGDEFMKLYDKYFLDAEAQPNSPFPVEENDPDSYRQIEQSIRELQLPPEELIKIEEIINYFQYDYPLPPVGRPFSLTTELETCPWQPSHLLLHIGLQGKITGDMVRLKTRDFVIASNLKTQVTFHPENVKAYRLIGYAHRNPIPGGTADARLNGYDLRIAQAATTLYEIIPKENPSPVEPAKQLIAAVTVNYTNPDHPDTGPLELTRRVFLETGNAEADSPSDNFKFSAAAAQLGMMLKNPRFNNIPALNALIDFAADAMGEDRFGYRAAFIKMLESYKTIIEERRRKE